MSLITGSTNVHSFVALTKDAKPAMGQRLIRLIAKGANKSPNLSESLAVSIPRVTQDDVADVIDRLLPHVVGMVQDAQDTIVREWRIEHGREAIPETVFSVEEVIAYLDATAAGDRVNAEYLQAWFMEEYEQAAQAFIANAMSLDITPDNIPEVVTQKTNVLRDMFAGWSSPKYSPNIPKLRAMCRFAASVSELDGRMTALAAKCGAMLKKKEEELAENALGF
jgi:hypothetical protein